MGGRVSGKWEICCSHIRMKGLAYGYIAVFADVMTGFDRELTLDDVNDIGLYHGCNRGL